MQKVNVVTQASEKNEIAFQIYREAFNHITTGTQKIVRNYDILFHLGSKEIEDLCLKIKQIFDTIQANLSNELHPKIQTSV